MPESSTTVRDVFELPKAGAEGPDSWKTFKTKVSTEVKGIKSAAMPDLAEKVAELFDIPIPDIFLTSWRKAEGIKSLLEESRKSPETAMHAELGEHTINSQHRPHIEIRIQNKFVKKLEFTLKLTFNLRGFVLKIQDGRIQEIKTGSCDARGKLEYQGLVIAEKKLAPITLPGVLPLHRGVAVARPEKTKATEEKPAAVLAASAEKIPATSEGGATANAGGQPRAAEVAAPTPVVELAEPKEPETPGLQSGLKVSATSALPPSPDVAPNMVEAAEKEPEKPAVTTDSPDVISAEPELEVAHPTPEPATEAEERMTWEVGDDEPIASSLVSDSKIAEPESKETEESAEDVISRMSRELAEKRAEG